jgi:hypothetical protein
VPELPLLFDPDEVPWPTTWGEWALCIVPDLGRRVWVEHALIAAMTDADRFSDEYREYFLAIGGRVARTLGERPGLVIEGMAREIAFASRPDVPVRIGTFGGQTFAFLPKPEFEGRN